MNNNNRANDFRYIYSNGLKIQLTGNEVMLLFGIKEDPTAAEDVLREEVGVVLGLATAKLLALTLTRTIHHFEATTNVQIPVDPAKMENLEKILGAVTDQSKPSSTV